MRKIVVTGAQVKSLKLNDSGEVGYLTIIATVFKNKTKHSVLICAMLKDKMLKDYQANPNLFERGINIGGNFDVSSFTDNTNKMHPRITITPDWIEPNDSYGSGLLNVNLSKARFAEDLKETESAAYAKMAYNYTESNKTLWCDSIFLGDMAKRAKAMKFKKGSTCDLIANFDVEVNEKDGKQYLNVLLQVKEISYAAIPPKAANTNPAEPTPTPAPMATPTSVPTTPAPSTVPTVPQETALEESDLSGEPSENDFF